MVWSNKFTSPATWPLNLIFAIASFQLVERAIPTRDIWSFRCWNNSEDAEVIEEEVAIFSHYCTCWFLTVLPLFFGMFCFRPGRDDVSFWAPWAEVPQDWEVNTIKYPRSLVYLKFGEAKLEIWLNNCWKVRVKLEHQSLFQWNYSNRLFGMVSSTLHVYTITSVVNLWEEKLPLSLYSIL